MKSFAALLFAAAISCMSIAAQQSAKMPAQPSPEAQQTNAAGTQAAARQSNARAVPVPSTANAPEVGNPQLRPVPGELETKIDTKTSRPGESVVVRTTERAATADGIVIPKGSKIVGHVTSVEPHEQGNENARVTLQFDQAQLKGGQALPIKSVIQSVAPAAGTNATTDSAPSKTSSADNAQAGENNTTTSATASAHAPVVGTVVEKKGSEDIRTTAIPGVLLAADANGQPFPNASGALVGSRKNVHLDGGTKLVLAVADVPLRNSR